MKKTLLAAAVVSAFAAPAIAQNVTISGNLDVAGYSVTGTQLISNGNTIATTRGTGTTSVINIQAVEDLGGGMRVTAKYGLDPRTLTNDNISVTNSTGANGASATLGNTTTGLGRDEAFVGISGAFGNLRIGAPNSIGLNSFQVSSFLGTGIGSGYAPESGTMTGSFSAIRYSRSVRYDSPAINGLTVSVLYAPGGDNAQVTNTTVTGGAAAAFPTPNARAATEVGLRFAQGPLTLSYARIQQDQQTNATGYYAGGSASGYGPKTSVNIFDASFIMGSTAIGAGWHRGGQLTTTGTVSLDTTGYRVSARQDMGTFDLIAQYTRYEQDLTATTTATPSVIGFRADYKLSKTSAIYAGYESWQTDRAYSAGASQTVTGKRNMGSLGIRKAF